MSIRSRYRHVGEGLCQHGRPASTCRLSCGIAHCMHPCCDHDRCEFSPGDVVEEDMIRRECSHPSCSCGMYVNPATEGKAREFGRAFGAAMARDFVSTLGEQGEGFTWDGMDETVRQLAKRQWGHESRYGFEEAVGSEAVSTWRRMRPAGY